jgi:hypothetical protein
MTHSVAQTRETHSGSSRVRNKDFTVNTQQYTYTGPGTGV